MQVNSIVFIFFPFKYRLNLLLDILDKSIIFSSSKELSILADI